MVQQSCQSTIANSCKYFEQSENFAMATTTQGNIKHWALVKDILRPDKPVIFVDTDGIGVPSLEKRTDIRMLSPDSSNVSNNGKASRVTYSKGVLLIV